MLRKTLLVVAIAAALPTPPDSGAPASGIADVPASVFSYVTAAADTVADVRGFCARNASVCVTANSFATGMEAKAKYSARLIYEWANEATSSPTATELPPLPADLADIDKLATGSAAKGKTLAVSQSTLTLEDLIPEWQAPPQG